MNGDNYRNGNRLSGTVYWTYSTVNTILHREMYLGNMVQGTKHQCMRGRQKKIAEENQIVVKHTHEPIIDEETWEKARTLLTKKVRDLNLNPQTSRNILAGFVKCGDCGRAMAKYMKKGPDGRREYRLTCGTYRRNGRKYCTPHTIALSVLEQLVSDDLRTLLAGSENRKALVELQHPAVQESVKETDREFEKKKTELEHVKRLKKNLYEDYREGLLSREEYISYREDYGKKEALYVRQMENMEKIQKNQERERERKKAEIRRLLEGGGAELLDRRTVVEMISEIKIYENRRIRIIYNFGNESKNVFDKT